jgi:hypothetical protein
VLVDLNLCSNHLSLIYNKILISDKIDIVLIFFLIK